MNVLGTGLTGLVGSRIVELLSPQYVFQIFPEHADITDERYVDEWIHASDAPWVFHLAAFTDVDKGEEQKKLGVESLVWQVNVQGTAHIVDACRKTGKHLLYISTDYVFSGTMDRYTEEDVPSPKSWYGITKYEGEKLVKTLGSNGLIIRIANPYRARFQGKEDFVHKIIKLLSSGMSIQAPSDQLFVPTFIDDIARAFQVLVAAHADGIFHVVGSQTLSPFDAAGIIAKAYELPVDLVQNVRFEEFFSGRAPRPFHASLGNDKITKRGVYTSTFIEGIARMKEQEEGMR